MYVNLLDSMLGFENLREAREGIFNKVMKKTKEIYPQENVIINNDYIVNKDGTIGEKDGTFKKKIRTISNPTPKPTD